MGDAKKRCPDEKERIRLGIEKRKALEEKQEQERKERVLRRAGKKQSSLLVTALMLAGSMNHFGE